jgi:viroplasmin and RNaseH domain-containing protein
MSYQYLVTKGRVPGLYNTWADCSAQISGYSGAVYSKVKKGETPAFRYLVTKGRIPGIYDTWAECSAQVTGYAGAIYKKVAMDAANDPELLIQPSSVSVNVVSAKEPAPSSSSSSSSSSSTIPDDMMVVFTDGSCVNNGKPIYLKQQRGV